MTKAASVSFGLVFLFATATVSRAQPAPEDDAIKEAIRRQANVITLRQKLAQAGEAEARKDLVAAAKLYGNAYELVQSIGPGEGIEAETAQTIAGVASVRLELARQAQKRGDLPEAKTQVDQVLKVDPQNTVAIEFKRLNDKALEEMAGRIPSDAARERVASARTNRIAAMTKVTDGRILLEAGKLDDAEAKFKEAMTMDPENRAAFYYLNLVKEARFGEAERRREQDSRQGVVEIERAWARSVKRDALPVPNPYATTNLIYTGKGRQAIVGKLDRIRMDTVLFQKLGLSEVIKNLSEEAKKRDPERKGINFMVDPNAVAAAPAAAGPIDPTTGSPAAAAPAEATDINTVSINIDPPLNDVRLADVMDAIVRVADKPIKYSLEDYAVVFSLKGPEAVPLYIRNFKVDPNTFYQGLEAVTPFAVGAIQTSGGQGGGGGVGGGGGAGGQGSSITTIPRVDVSGGGGGISGGGGGVGGGGQGGQGGGGLSFITRTNNMQQVSDAVAAFFTTLGVDLSPTARTAGKSVFWNDRSGVLMVRATSQDLDIIEAAIEVLNRVPHQINIRTKFAEITQDDSKAFGFDWYLGNFLMNNKSIVSSGGSQPSLNSPASTANQLGFFPGTSAGTALAPAGSDQLITSGLRNTVGAQQGSIPSIATFTGILTDPQFRVVMRAMEQRQGADLLASPEVTTVSGRQAQVQVVDLQTIVTGVQQNSGQQGQQVATGGGTTVQAAAPVFQTPQTQVQPFGPVLDVVPYISSDGYTIQMTLIPTLSEFVGYDDPGQFVPQAITGGGIPITSVLPLPHFRVRQVTTTAVVWDGQTIVLGGLISDNVTRIKDKVPVLGDIPLIGKLFRSESSETKKKNLVIFVTPTIIDPAGNRLHTEDEMPFAQTAIPPQSKVSNP